MSDWDVMRGPLMRLSSSLVVDLGSSDVPVPQEFLHLRNIYSRLQKKGGSSRPERMGRVDASQRFASVRVHHLAHCLGEASKISKNQVVHCRGLETSLREPFAAGIKSGPEEGTARKSGLLDV